MGDQWANRKTGDSAPSALHGVDERERWSCGSENGVGASQRGVLKREAFASKGSLVASVT